jgi:alpha-D-ribose 1-methylphosphonate 5-triphosphate synthase subunit PhnI
MYVAVKGGEKAIAASAQQLARERRGDGALAELSVAQIRSQMRLAVDRVMTEGSVYDPELAALAIKQAQGDLVEAIFLLRAYRTTLPRFGYALPLDTARMQMKRRISATFKDVPGGQVLGGTYDYTQRLLDFSLLADQGEVAGSQAAGPADAKPVQATADSAHNVPRVSSLLADEGLIETPAPDMSEPADLTRAAPRYPASRALRLQNLARGDEGFLLALGYSTQRGYANNHPFAGEIRAGSVAVSFFAEELGEEIELGEIEVTEVEMVNQFGGSKEVAPQFTSGYGLAFGGAERKAIAMALVDRALRADDFSEERSAPAQMEEFVLSHSDNVEASGFVQHLKLPHYVDFQSELELIRRLRAEIDERLAADEAQALARVQAHSEGLDTEARLARDGSPEEEGRLEEGAA